MSDDPHRLEAALQAIDAANAKDPRSMPVDGEPAPANLVYGRRMSLELLRFAPDASVPLQIAARGQHIERWIIPRAEFPMTRPGYLQWRRALRDHHAARLREIMTSFGFEAGMIERVGEIVRKQRLPQDRDVQILEDVICIVFLKYELGAFAPRYADDQSKLAEILAKTWKKMSPAGQSAALAIPPPDHVVALLRQGLAALDRPAAPDRSALG